MRSSLKAIASISCGLGLSMGVANATLAINNLAQDVEQQAVNESADSLSDAVSKEERTPEGVHRVQGVVLRIDHNNYWVNTYTGDVLHLYLDDNSQVIGSVGPGDRIVAMVDDLKHVLLIQPDQ